MSRRTAGTRRSRPCGRASNQGGNCGLIVGGCVGYPWRAKRPVGVVYLPVYASNVSEQPVQIFKVGLDLRIHVDDPQVVGLFDGYGVSLGIGQGVYQRRHIFLPGGPTHPMERREQGLRRQMLRIEHQHFDAMGQVGEVQIRYPRGKRSAPLSAWPFSFKENRCLSRRKPSALNSALRVSSRQLCGARSNALIMRPPEAAS